MLPESDLQRRAVSHVRDTVMADFLYHAAEFYLNLAEQGVLEPTRDQLGRLRRHAISMTDLHKLFNMEAVAARKHEHVTYWYKKAHGLTSEEDDKAYATAYNKFRRPDGEPDGSRQPKFPGSHANARQMGYISPALAEIFRAVIEAKKSWDNADEVLEAEATLQKLPPREKAPSPSPKRARDDSQDEPEQDEPAQDEPVKRARVDDESAKRRIVISPEKKTQIHNALRTL